MAKEKVAITTATKYVVEVSSVSVFADETISSVRLEFKQSIPGFAKNENGTFTPKDVNYIDTFRSKFTAQLCAVNEDIAFYRACLGYAMEAKHFSIILFGAKMTIVRTLVKEGEMFEQNGVQVMALRNLYLTDVESVQLSNKSKALFEKATENALAL